MEKKELPANEDLRTAADVKVVTMDIPVAQDGDQKTKEAWRGQETLAEKKVLAPAKPEEDDGAVRWEWLHKTGFRSYSQAEGDRIEKHFQMGVWMMRMKSGTGRRARPREIYFYDMVQFDPVSGNQRSIRRVPEPTMFCRLKRSVLSMTDAFLAGDQFWWRPKTFEFFEKRRELEVVDEAELIKEKYRPDSFAFRIVKSWLFVTFAYSMIIGNSFYIWIDADHNEGTTYRDTAWVFIVWDNIFTMWFLVEVLLRWFAFRSWKVAIFDAWFVLDVLLVGMMIFETWLLQLVVYIFVGEGETQQLNKISILRVLRLLRLARVARLFKVFPQLVVIIKGMCLAVKSLVYTLLLLCVLTFVGAVIFKNFSDVNDGLKELKYGTVGGAFWNLLIYGMFLDSVGEMLFALKELNETYALTLMAYIFISNLTMLNMLIGILCEVISKVSTEEANGAAMTDLQESIMEIWECYDVEDDHRLRVAEFDAMMKNPDLKVTLQSHDVDHSDILKLRDVLFQERVNEDGSVTIPNIRFPVFLEKVLQLRGGNTATVGDVVELRSFMQAKFNTLEASCSQGLGAQTGDARVDPGQEVCANTEAAAVEGPPRDPVLDAPPLPGQLPLPPLQLPRSEVAMNPLKVQETVLAQLFQIRANQEAMQRDMKDFRMQLLELQHRVGPPAEV